MAVLPIPPVVWDRLRDFLAAGRSGRLVLNIKAGEVLGYELTESARVESDRTVKDTACLGDTVVLD
jgi:hypothetical protein